MKKRTPYVETAMAREHLPFLELEARIRELEEQLADAKGATLSALSGVERAQRQRDEARAQLAAANERAKADAAAYEYLRDRYDAVILKLIEANKRAERAEAELLLLKIAQVEPGESAERGK